MDDFNFDSFNDNESEIDRIQKEINKDLSGGNTEPVVEVLYQNEVPSDSAKDTVSAEIPSVGLEHQGTAPHTYAAAVPTDTASDASTTDSFYMETVKNERTKNKKHQFRKAIIVACIVSIIGGPLIGLSIGIGSAIATKYLSERPEVSESPAFSFDNGEIAQISVAPNPSSIIDDFSTVVDIVEPSVVGITSVVSSQGGNSFFPQARESEGKGSGIIFDEDAENVYIVTNYHVVGGANTVNVSVENSDVVMASLVGAEQNSDLAVISILKSDLAAVGVNSVKVAKFGSSENMKVGDIVLAIGNALGEGNTATLGIVSAKNKEIAVEGLTLSVMQTDAAINPGNSGGPLINTKGEVVAINTAKFQYYEVEGTGYSITIDEAKPIIEQLRNRTPKPFIGIGMEDMSEEAAALYNLPAMGVLVTSVVAGSAGEKAGLLRNDVITGFNGKPVFTHEVLSELVSECKVGDVVEVKIYRLDVGALTINITLGERPMSSSF